MAGPGVVSNVALRTQEGINWINWRHYLYNYSPQLLIKAMNRLANRICQDYSQNPLPGFNWLTIDNLSAYYKAIVQDLRKRELRGVMREGSSEGAKRLATTQLKTRLLLHHAALDKEYVATAYPIAELVAAVQGLDITKVPVLSVPEATPDELFTIKEWMVRGMEEAFSGTNRQPPKRRMTVKNVFGKTKKY